MGLLLPHIFTVTLFPDMVTVSQNRQTSHVGGGKRDVITGFSGESRYRLFRLFHSLRFSKFTFVTLTYGSTFPDDYRISKRHLQDYRRFMEKEFGALPVVWRAEVQQRGAIHYHLLYLDAPFIPVQVVESIWHRARGTYGLETTRNSVHLRANRRNADPRLVAAYVGKYLSKPTKDNGDEPTHGIGRVWGKWNIKEPECLKIKLYEVEKNQLTRMLLGEQEERGWRPLSQDSYTCFGSTMGTGLYQELVTSFIKKVVERRERLEHRNVTFDTVKMSVPSV